MTKSNSPLVSIGLPVYNGEKLLRRALDSLLAQEYANFELIISDNASTDGTEGICREYAARDNRIRYIRQTKNMGGQENFNFVLHEANGEYFMWAAFDDQWATSFIHSLLESLMNNPGAVGAFCPYQLIDDESAVIIEGVWKCNYQNRLTLLRLLKFTWYYRDMCIYGLMRRRYMNDVQFEPWAWPNSGTYYNIAYPLVFFLLSKGDFLFIGERPLWFKAVTVSRWHAVPFMNNPLLGYLAHIARKINLFLRSVRYIFQGSSSILLVLLMIPILLIRGVFDCITPVYAAIRIWSSGKRINQLSPHEIWQLGVR